MRNNRTAGHKFELKLLKWLKDIFPNAVTARSESKRLDDSGVDFAFTDLWQFQAKHSCNNVNYSNVLDKMPIGLNVLIHEKTEKSNKNFLVKETYAIMDLDTFKILLTNHQAMLNHTTKIKKKINR